MRLSKHLAPALFAMAVAVLACACAPRPETAGIPANKKEIMDRFVEGTLPASYAPAAFFVHYRFDQTAGEPAVMAHMEYFLKSNQDILKVQFEQQVPKIDELELREDWIPEDFYRPTLEIVRRLQEIAGADVYVLPTIYSPHQVTRQSLTEEQIFDGARNHRDALKSVLASYCKALTWFERQCKAAGIQGFYMCAQGGEHSFSVIPDFFDDVVKPFDLALMNDCCDGTKMNILHICDWEGPYDDLHRYKDYPGQIVNTPMTIEGEPFSLADAYEIFKRPILGGFDRKGVINTADAAQIPALVNDIFRDGPAGKVMLGADCTVGSAPFANIHTAISTAHSH